MTSSTAAVLADVHDERSRQIDLGYHPDHDAAVDRSRFAWLILRRAVDLAHPFIDAHPDYRHELVEIAAIAVAAIEAHDREDD